MTQTAIETQAPNAYKDLPQEIIEQLQPHVQAAVKAAHSLATELVAIKNILNGGYEDSFRRIVTDILHISEQHAYRLLTAQKFLQSVPESVDAQIIPETAASLLGAESTPQEARDAYFAEIKETGKAPTIAETRKLIKQHVEPVIVEATPEPTKTPLEKWLEMELEVETKRTERLADITELTDEEHAILVMLFNKRKANNGLYKKLVDRK